ncbi:hypothetical protein D0Z07_1390 [Hyphodiscus hymeniophilus]|uniref:Uncharacterized protein n=1 Tax=Hyphodiscus hymeniophilus TaxID=353542 RepID=A0A9P6VRC6_9HELO|nr:hypothetical protein D0Z07_1390 [Hyphodiscus hymeniophilus]
MESPFNDKEKRFVLSEVIKTSSVPVDKLLAFINESGVQPEWNKILMPFGRNLDSCINFWDTLRGGHVSASLPPHSAPDRKRKSDGLEPLQIAPQPKRRQSGAETMIRIQPKPSSNGSPHAFSTLPATQPKKRGRPSKADIEARNAKAIARGEIIAPPRTLAARESVGGDASTESATSSGGFGSLATSIPTVASGPVQDPRMSMSFQSGPSEGESSDMAEKKKRSGRPSSKSSKEPKQGEGSFSSFVPHSGQYGMPRPPSILNPTEEPTRSPPLPPKTEEGGFGAPIYPAIDALLATVPPRPERPGPE